MQATDIDGDVLTWSVAGAPLHGTLTLYAGTGAYTYEPAAGFSGTDVFDVLVRDPSGAASMQRVSIDVTPVADQPTLFVVNPVVVPLDKSHRGYGEQRRTDG